MKDLTNAVCDMSYRKAGFLGARTNYPADVAL